jgi:hypothetical protein
MRTARFPLIAGPFGDQQRTSFLRAIMALPYGKMDLEGEALKLYESDERERLFSEAYERFPDYQGAQLLDALDYIMDGFEERFASKYSEADWQAILEPLAEHVQNGLT